MFIHKSDLVLLFRDTLHRQCCSRWLHHLAQAFVPLKAYLLGFALRRRCHWFHIVSAEGFGAGKRSLDALGGLWIQALFFTAFAACKACEWSERRRLAMVKPDRLENHW